MEPNNKTLVERMIAVWEKRNQGHSSLPSSIELEKSSNPFIRVQSQDIQRSLQKQYPDTDPHNPEQIFALLRQHKDSKAYRKLPLPAFLK